MHKLVEGYKEQYPEHCSSLKLHYAARRGYFFSVEAAKFDHFLPPIFIQSKKQGKRVICSTEELNRLTSRSNDALNEIYILTEKILGELVAKVRSHLGQ